MKNLILIIMLIIVSNGAIINNENIINKSFIKNSNIYNYVYSMVDIFNNKKTSRKYTKLIIKNAKKYNIDEKMYARQIMIESSFKRYAKSSKGAVGLAQIIPKYWLHLLNNFDDIELKKNMKQAKLKSGYSDYMYWAIYEISLKKKITETQQSNLDNYKLKRDKYIRYIKKYFYIPEYNLEMGAMIVRKYLDKNKQNKYKAYYDYNAGGNRKKHIKESVVYAENIIDGTKLHYDLKLYHNWKYVKWN